MRKPAHLESQGCFKFRQRPTRGLETLTPSTVHQAKEKNSIMEKFFQIFIDMEKTKTF